MGILMETLRRTAVSVEGSNVDGALNTCPGTPQQGGSCYSWWKTGDAAGNKADTNLASQGMNLQQASP